MPEQGPRNRAVRYRAICPHGKNRGHCTGPYINLAVVAKRPKRGMRTPGQSPIGARRAVQA